MRIVVTPSLSPLRGIVPAPLDRAAATYAVALASMATGRDSLLEGRGLSTLAVESELSVLGAEVAPLTSPSGARRGLRIRGGGLEFNCSPTRALEAGDDLPAMVALCALGVALPSRTRLSGLSSPHHGAVMASVARALRQRGAAIEGHMTMSPAGRPLGALEPPYELGPATTPLSPLSFDLDGLEASASTRALVKVALLLSGLRANGTTQLIESTAGDDLLPRLLGAASVPMRTLGPLLALDGPVRLAPLEGELPADPTMAAALLALSLQVPESCVGVRRVPTRPAVKGWLEALTDAGARMRIEPKRDSLGQPAADVTLAPDLARPIELGGERAARAGLSLPMLAAFGLRSPAGSVSRLFDLDATDEDRRATLSLIESFGGIATAHNDGIEVIGVGSARLTANTLDCRGDAAVAGAALVLAVGSDGPCVIEGAESLPKEAPRLVSTMRSLGAAILVERASGAEVVDGTSAAPSQPTSR